MSGKLDKIKEQLEYYLCDENLQQDEFFREQITSSPEVKKIQKIKIITI